MTLPPEALLTVCPRCRLNGVRVPMLRHDHHWHCPRCGWTRRRPR